MLGVLQVVFAIGVLVFVHELGHFLAAKWAGVRVEVFSFGFGPFLFSFRRGETIYAVSLVPLGGYVKMTGQADIGRVRERGSRPAHSYLAKPPSKRAVIVLAGVTMNVVLAFVVFFAASLIGVKGVPPVVGGVLKGSPAEQAGISEGDRVLEVNGAAVSSFQAIRSEIAMGGAGEVQQLKVRRTDGSVVDVSLRAGELSRAELADIGILPAKYKVRAGVEFAPGLGVLKVHEGTPAEEAGLEPFDHIVSVDGESFRGLDGFKAALRSAGGEVVELGVRRPGVVGELVVRVEPRKAGTTAAGVDYQVGFEAGKVVSHVAEDSSASTAKDNLGDEGLRPGDVVVGVLADGDEATFFLHRKGAVAGRPRQLTVPRDMGTGPVIESDNDRHELVEQGGPLESLAYGVTECGSIVRRTFRAIYSFVSGRTSAKHVAGPIGIVRVTYYSTSRGPGYYFWFIGLISVNLAVLNLLPMMPLDGGLFVFLLYEAVRGRPASPRVQEAAQVIGLVLILALVVFATRNDIGWLSSGRS